mmetsp:Transcript_13243/g.18989  ORF Transcript_13243/g.18989 Transcript_13243/m.18989 type:complete len:153 (+) Transcript_13243:1-459(+)
MEYYGFTSYDTDKSHSTLAQSQIDDSDSKKEVVLRCIDIFHADHLALIAMKKSNVELEARIMCLEKAREYAALYIGKTLVETSLTIIHKQPPADGSEESKKSDQFCKYLQNERSNNHKLLNSCLVGYGLKASCKPYDGRYNSGNWSITIETL